MSMGAPAFEATWWTTGRRVTAVVVVVLIVAAILILSTQNRVSKWAFGSNSQYADVKPVPPAKIATDKPSDVKPGSAPATLTQADGQVTEVDGSDFAAKFVKRFDGIDTQIDSLGQRVDKLEKQGDQHSQQIDSLEKRKYRISTNGIDEMLRPKKQDRIAPVTPAPGPQSQSQEPAPIPFAERVAPVIPTPRVSVPVMKPDRITKLKPFPTHVVRQANASVVVPSEEKWNGMDLDGRIKVAEQICGRPKLEALAKENDLPYESALALIGGLPYANGKEYLRKHCGVRVTEEPQFDNGYTSRRIRLASSNIEDLEIPPPPAVEREEYREERRPVGMYRGRHHGGCKLGFTRNREEGTCEKTVVLQGGHPKYDEPHAGCPAGEKRERTIELPNGGTRTIRQICR